MLHGTVDPAAGFVTLGGIFSDPLDVNFRTFQASELYGFTSVQNNDQRAVLSH